jgi:hypothetical protein
MRTRELTAKVSGAVAQKISSILSSLSSSWSWMRHAFAGRSWESSKEGVDKVFRIAYLPRRRIGRYRTESWQRRSASTRTCARAMLRLWH